MSTPQAPSSPAEQATAGSDHLAVIQMILCTLFWGAFFVFGKLAVAEATPLAVATLRFVVAGVVLVVLLAWREPQAFRVAPRDLLIALGLGLTGVALYNALAFVGFVYAPASDGAMISPSLNPVLTALLAAWIFREPLTRARLSGIALALVGIGLVFAGPLLQATSHPQRWLGDLLFLLSAVVWSFYTLLGKLAVGRFSSLASTTYATILGALLLVPFSWHDLSLTHWAQLSWRFWGAIAVLALLCTVAAFMFWYGAIRRLGASRTASFLPLVPIFGVLLGIGLLGDRPGPVQVVGMLLAIGGVYLANRPTLAAR